MSKKISRDFFLQNTIQVAQNLLGVLLVREYKGTILKGIISETEAYLGKEDSSCHTYKKKTERNSIMYKIGGFSYIYFIYGMHYLFNIVSEGENIPCAVLIRKIYPLVLSNEFDKNLKKEKLSDGPAKLCKVFYIDKSLNNHDLTLGKTIWIEKYLKINKNLIQKNKRIGIHYALEKDRNALLRFSLENKKIEELLSK